MNRYELESMRGGLVKSLDTANQELAAMYTDPNTEKASREGKRREVEDLEERLAGINKQIKAMDDAAAQKLRKSESGDPKAQMTVAKAAYYRSVLTGEPMATEKATLLDNAATGGGKLLPKTVSNQLIAEPLAKNPLRGLSAFTNITNLEIPRIAFTLDGDGFIQDGETAKELSAVGDTVKFGRNKFKVFSGVSETVLRGTDTDLVSTIENALASGVAKKEKTVAFAASPADEYRHMSFYAQTTPGTYDIKAVEGDTLYKAIKKAIGDLEEDYRDNATVVMRYADYLEIIETLANGNATLYAAQPSSIIGKPVVFCDLATVPVVGDFSYSHYNYDLEMQADHDKDVKAGVELFVLTAYFDHQIKLKSAFRLAVVKTGAASE